MQDYITSRSHKAGGFIYLGYRMEEQEESMTLDTIWKGGINHFRGFMSQYRTLEIRLRLSIHGPISQGNSISWLIVNGGNYVLDAYRDNNTKGKSYGYGGYTLKLDEMTFEQFLRKISQRGFDLLELLHIGQITATELPGERLRVFFEVGGFEPHSMYWEWVNELKNEMARLGFDRLSDREDKPVGSQRQKLERYFYNPKCETTPAHIYDISKSYLFELIRENGNQYPLWGFNIEERILDRHSVQYEICRNLFSRIGFIEVVPNNDEFASVIIYGYSDINNYITSEEYQTGQTFLRGLASRFEERFGTVNVPTPLSNATLTNQNTINPPSVLRGYTPEQRKKLDEACIAWVGRGYLPKQNLSEFLRNFDDATGIFLSVDQFKNVLKDAGRRGLIVKANRRWKSPENSPLNPP